MLFYLLILNMNNQLLLQTKTHELDELKGKLCISCNSNFYYKINGNKFHFKKKDMAYYKLFNDNVFYYIHEKCYDDCLDKYVTDDQKLVVDNNIMTNMSLFDKFGTQLTKVNYVKQIKKWCQEKTDVKFMNDVRDLFNDHLHFSFHCISYYFKNNKIYDFERRKKDFIFKGTHVSDKITPDVCGSYLSRK